jgi:rhamnose transport system ATP-binding protein
MNEPLFQAVAIGKTFGGTIALREVSLTVHAGRVHGLIGENGAGKSTLSKIIAGVVTPDSGSLLKQGRDVRLTSPRMAQRLGIAYIGQERTLVPSRSVIENVFLGIESRSPLGVVRRGALLRRYERLTETTGMRLPPGRAVRRLSAPEQQQVEILRALARGAELLVMDEPTAALGHEEVRHVLATVRSLRDRGRAVVYVSHAIEEVVDSCDDVTILRDGRVIASGPVSEQTRQSLVVAMVGEELAESPQPRQSAQPPPDEPVLVAAGIARRGVLSDVSLTVARGELLALTGLLGSGAAEIARVLAGADQVTAGRVAVASGQTRQRVRSPRRSWRQGIAFIPESRIAQGIVPDRSVAENITLPHLRRVSRFGVVLRRRERALAADLIRQLGIRCSGPDARIRTLSGGNQQKVLFARALFAEPVVVVAIEPTIGVDVGARRAIHQAMVALTERGIPVVLATSDAEEVLDLGARVLVLKNGAAVAQFPSGAATRENLLAAAAGVVGGST